MENFDRENIDELLEIHQICQYFPRQIFAPYGILPIPIPPKNAGISPIAIQTPELVQPYLYLCITAYSCIASYVRIVGVSLTFLSQQSHLCNIHFR